MKNLRIQPCTEIPEWQGWTHTACDLLHIAGKQQQKSGRHSWIRQENRGLGLCSSSQRRKMPQTGSFFKTKSPKIFVFQQSLLLPWCNITPGWAADHVLEKTLWNIPDHSCKLVPLGQQYSQPRYVFLAFFLWDWAKHLLVFKDSLFGRSWQLPLIIQTRSGSSV